MKDWLTHLFTPPGGTPPGGQEWRLGADGLSSGWAFFLFLILAAATVWAYRRFAPGLTPWRRRLLILLRLFVIAAFAVLLTKPVINITINEPIRQNLVLLFDTSKSMAFHDQRTRPDDLKRAALAAGLLDPAKGLKQELPAGDAAKIASASRWDLLQQLAANTRLNLLPRLGQKSDLTLYKFGRDATAAGTLQPDAPGDALTTTDAAHALAALHPDQPATAVGEALREVLQETRGQPTAGIVLVTDGGSNSGLPPAEAAQMARDANVPLFIYGVGITSPPDLIMSEVSAPKIGFAKERVEVQAKLRAQGLAGRSVTVSLKANGKEVDAQKVDLGPTDGDHNITFRFVPDTLGELVLEASTPVLPDEIGKDNNTASTKLRVVDNKVHVLLIEQQPRWDFRYLLAYLQGDRRLDVRAVVINSEPDLDKLPNSPFLPGLPENKEAIFNSEVVIIGDVNPADLGDTRMKLIRDWVESAGGGIIFLAGPKFDPVAYAGTPLESLLPVVPASGVTAEQYAERSLQPMPLKLTPLGENSPYLQMAPTPQENARVWNAFPGVRWTARVARAKPGARVLLVDPRADRADQGGALPVFAIQEYGSGTCVYIGTDETYRWRSHVGGQYYSTFWGQIMESLSLQRLQDASSLIRLKTDRQQYFVGDKSGHRGQGLQTGFHARDRPNVARHCGRPWPRPGDGQARGKNAADGPRGVAGRGGRLPGGVRRAHAGRLPVLHARRPGGGAEIFRSSNRTWKERRRPWTSRCCDPWPKPRTASFCARRTSTNCRRCSRKRARRRRFTKRSTSTILSGGRWRSYFSPRRSGCCGV